MSRAGRDALCLAVGAASTAVAVWLYWRRQPRQPLEPPAPLATRLPVLPAASLTDGAAAAAVRAAGVCVVHDVLSADELAEIGQRIAALTPRKMQNRRPQRWEHVHDPASEAFKRPAVPGSNRSMGLDDQRRLRKKRRNLTEFLDTMDTARAAAPEGAIGSELAAQLDRERQEAAQGQGQAISKTLG